jgi:putative ABC transport system permease protein
MRAKRWWDRLTGRADADLDRELRAHLALEEEEQRDAGRTARDARDGARRALGNLPLIREDTRAAWGWTAIERAARDVRYGLRGLWRTKWLSAAAVITLALGIGANTALFSVVDAVLLHALPFREPRQLVMVTQDSAGLQQTVDTFAPTTFFDWRRHAQSFIDLAAIHKIRVNLLVRGEPLQAQAQEVSPNVFDLLGLQPVLGRTMTPQEGLPGRNHVVILSYRLWQERFDGDPAVIGQAVTLNGKPRTIIGVLPSTFELLTSEPSLWVPLALNPDVRWDEGRYLQVLGRLRPGARPAQAALELGAITDRLGTDAPLPVLSGVHDRVALVGLLDHSVGDLRYMLLVLLAAVACVLVVACTNVAGLLLARATTRQRELALRVSLGATRGRLIAQLLTESLTLAAIGGGLGLLVAWSGVHALIALVPPGIEVPRVDQIGPNLTVLGFTLAIILATGVLFGVFPAWHASSPALAMPLRHGARGSVGGGSRRLRGGLVIVEVALAMVLLVGAALLARSFAYLRTVNPGFSDHHVLTVNVAPAGAAYDSNAQQAAFFARALARVREVPGVRRAAVIDYLPVTGIEAATDVRAEGERDPTPGQMPTLVRSISPQYFATLAIPLLQGRDLTDQDTPDRPRALIVNQALVDRVFGGGVNPIGRRLVVFWGARLTGEIVGVVGNVRYQSLAREEGPTLYWAEAQQPHRPMHLVAQTDDEPALFTGAITRAIRSIDKEVPLGTMKTLADLRADAAALTRFSVTLLGAFASIAMLLALVGLFGVVAHGVAQRTPEIGVRLALGAAPGTILRMVLREGMQLVLAGVIAGTAVAFGVTRLLVNQLSGVNPTDSLTFIEVAVLLSCAAFAAVCLPALRAAHVDPVVALQQD